MGLIAGYILAVFMGKVDMSAIMSGGLISLPRILPFKPEFHMGAIASACIIFMVSAAETIGDTSALVSGGLNREITGEEMISKCGFTQKNITIISLSLSIGVGFTSASEIGIWNIFPDVIKTVFASNVVAVVFVVSIILSLILPEDMGIKKLDEK